MKKIITLVAVALVSFNFVACRQDDDSTEFNNQNAEKKSVFEKTSDTSIKTTSIASDTLQHTANIVDPDPPVKDGTRW